MASGRANRSATRRFQIRRHAVEIRCDPADLIEPFDRLLAAFPAAADVPRTAYDLRSRPDAPGYVVERDGVRLQEARWPDGLVGRILWEVFQDALRAEDGVVAIHAGVVSYGGRAMVLPAPMNTGKTTMVAALVSAGLDYLSDEAALLDSGGRVLPFPKPLTFEPDATVLLPELHALAAANEGMLRRHVAADELRVGSIGEASEIAWVVAMSRRGGSSTSLRPVSRGEALARLANNAFNLDRLGADGVETLASALRRASTWELEVGELHETVRTLLGLVGSEGGVDPYATSQQNTNSM